MKKSLIAGIAAAGMFFGLVSSAGAVTVDELMAQIQALQSQLQNIQGAQTATLPSQQTTSSQASSGTTFVNISKNLTFGLKNDADVSALQQALKDKGFFTGDVTGNFFNGTLQAVKAFQAANGIDQTGFVGTQTRSALVAPGTPTRLDPNQGDTPNPPTPPTSPTAPAAPGSTPSPTVSPRSVYIQKTVTIGPPCNGLNSLASQRSYKPGDSFCIQFHVLNADESLHSFGSNVSYDIVSIDTPSSQVAYFETGNNQFNSHYGQQDDIYVRGVINSGVAPGVYTLTNHVATRGCTTHSALAVACGGWADSTVSTAIVVGDTVTTTGPSVQISANPSTITAGQSATLSWSSTGAVACDRGSVAAVLSAQGKSSGTSGTLVVSPTQTTSYDIYCTNNPSDVGTNSTSNSYRMASAVVTVSATPTTATAPTASLKVNNSHEAQSLAYGATPTLSWSSLGTVNACSITSGNGKYSYVQGSSGSITLSTGMTDSTTFTLTCSGPGGSATDFVIVSVAPQLLPGILPTVTLSSSPASITAGQSANLNATQSGASSCTLNGQSTALGFMSPITVTPAQTTTYTLTCTNPSGSKSASATVTVTSPIVTTAVAPTVSITASPSTVNAGQSSTLTMNQTGATACTLNGQVIGLGGNPTGTSVVTPSQTTYYTLTCVNGAGQSASATAVVAVANQLGTPVPTSTSLPPISISMSASPTTIVPGQSATITWSAQNADRCSVTSGAQGWGGATSGGALPLSGSATVSPQAGINYASGGGPAIYYMSCFNSVSGATKSVTINVAQSTSNALDAISQLLEQIRQQMQNLH